MNNFRRICITILRYMAWLAINTIVSTLQEYSKSRRY